MIRSPMLILLVGVAGLLGLGAAAWGGVDALPSYRAAWLFVLAVPVGALPLAMLHDLFARPQTPLSATLRRLLVVMPVAAVLAIPLLADLSGLDPSPPAEGFGGLWNAPAMVLGRSIVVLAIWLALALAFRQSPSVSASPGRQKLAGLGLGLHLVLGTLAASDWVGLIDPGLNSSALGLLVLAAQSGIALSVAGLIMSRLPVPLPHDLAPIMLILLGAWLFLQFTQYLVVWSANLPAEILWYIHRSNPFGEAVAILAFVVFLLVTIILLWRPGVRACAVAAGLILFVHFVEMFWLIVPAHRGTFSLTLADLLASIGLLGVATGAWLFLSKSTRTAGGLHGST